MIKGLFSQKTLTIPSGTKIFGYASGSTSSLTDYTTSTTLTKTGEQWLDFIETITGWQVSAIASEYNTFKLDSFTPNLFKVYSLSLANILGFIKDQLYTKDSNNEIVSTYWGSFKLVLGGSEYTIGTKKYTSVLQKCENEPTRPIESVVLVSGPVTDYIQAYDNQKFNLESVLNHFSKKVNFDQFNAFNCVGIGSTVTNANIPQLAFSTKTLRVGMLNSHFKTDLIPSKSMNKISYFVMEV